MSSKSKKPIVHEFQNISLPGGRERWFKYLAKSFPKKVKKENIYMFFRRINYHRLNK